VIAALLLGVALLSAERGGVSIAVSADSRAVDPAESVFLTVDLAVPAGHTAELPDLRSRVEGFSLAEDFAGERQVAADGSFRQTAKWRLVPEPRANVYRIRAFVVKVDGGAGDFVAGPITFDAPRYESVAGEMEVSPTKDLPPLSWKLACWILLFLALAALLVAGVVLLARLAFRKVREHRMSPLERAWAELSRLLKKKWPSRGRTKDFYVELTMVVRRYIQRRYGVKAPHLTTEEFFDALSSTLHQTNEQTARLHDFLSQADLVKFAGVQANEAMIDAAVASAKTFLQKDQEGEGHVPQYRQGN